jgi:hypothetical protein
MLFASDGDRAMEKSIQPLKVKPLKFVKVNKFWGRGRSRGSGPGGGKGVVGTGGGVERRGKCTVG